MAMAAVDFSSFKWSRARDMEARMKNTRPEPGSFFVKLADGFGLSYGGEKTNVGGKGVVADFLSSNGDIFYKARRIEKKSDDLPYHNVDDSAGVLLGMLNNRKNIFIKSPKAILKESAMLHACA